MSLRSWVLSNSPVYAFHGTHSALWVLTALPCPDPGVLLLVIKWLWEHQGSHYHVTWYDRNIQGLLWQLS